MGELANVSLSDDGVSDKEQCSKCGMEKKKGKENDCCKDEHKFVKTDDQNAGAKLVVTKSVVTLVSLPPFVAYNNDLYSLGSPDVNTGLPHAPPRADIYTHPIFIRVQSLLI